jgi:hypothetical protein
MKAYSKFYAFFLSSFILALNSFAQVNTVEKAYVLDTVFKEKSYGIMVVDEDHIWSNLLQHNGFYFFKSDSLDLTFQTVFSSRLNQFANKKISSKLSNEEYRAKVCSLVMDYYNHAEKNEEEEYVVTYDAQRHILCEQIKYLKGNKRMTCKFTLFLNDGTICFLLFHCDTKQLKWVEDYVHQSITIQS